MPLGHNIYSHDIYMSCICAENAVIQNPDTKLDQIQYKPACPALPGLGAQSPDQRRYWNITMSSFVMGLLISLGLPVGRGGKEQQRERESGEVNSNAEHCGVGVPVFIIVSSNSLHLSAHFIERFLVRYQTIVAGAALRGLYIELKAKDLSKSLIHVRWTPTWVLTSAL